MNDKTRKIVLLGFLALTAVWGYNNLSSRANAPETESAQSIPAIQAQMVNESGHLSESVVKALTEKPWGVDPFYHRTARYKKPTTQRKPKLQAIIYSENSPSAYISGKLVKVGDHIGKSKVIEIKTESVTLERDGKTFKLIIKTG